MKTTSSQLFRGVMFITTLVVLATMWWAAVRQDQAQKQAEQTPSLSMERELQMKHEQPYRAPLDPNSIEFAPTTAVRSAWDGHTEPDNVWNGQLERANQTLVRHHLPVLNVSYTPSPERGLPGR